MQGAERRRDLQRTFAELVDRMAAHTIRASDGQAALRTRRQRGGRGAMRDKRDGCGREQTAYHVCALLPESAGLDVTPDQGPGKSHEGKYDRSEYQYKAGIEWHRPAPMRGRKTLTYGPGQVLILINDSRRLARFPDDDKTQERPARPR